eukprot:COSAG04_NODE_21999_length_363_cov_0.780303_1_plen_61_part_10
MCSLSRGGGIFDVLRAVHPSALWCGGRDLRAGACGSAAEFVYSVETEQLSEAGRRWMCVDN